MINSLKYWGFAIRPKTLWVTFCPVLLGAVFAYREGAFVWLPSSIALLSGLCIQIGTNLANDYFDCIKGADKERVGPKRMAQSGLISLKAMKIAYCTAFLLAFILGLYLVYRGGWGIFMLGIISIMLGVLYTAGPFALAYTGLADGVAFLFFGPIATGATFYLNTLSLSMQPIWVSIALGSLAVAILTVNNLRDVLTDRKVGKKTLVVRFGRTFGRIEYVVCVSLPSVVAALLYWHTKILQFIPFTLLSMLLSKPLVRGIWQKEDADLDVYLPKTAQFLLVYTVLLSICLLQ